MYLLVPSTHQLAMETCHFSTLLSRSPKASAFIASSRPQSTSPAGTRSSLAFTPTAPMAPLHLSSATSRFRRPDCLRHGATTRGTSSTRTATTTTPSPTTPSASRNQHVLPARVHRSPLLPSMPNRSVTAKRPLSIRSQTSRRNSAAAASAPLPTLDAPRPQSAPYLPPPRSSVPFTVVMKFGGSSVADAARMREVAELILSFPEESPIVVMSAMGKTTNNLLKVGEKALTCGSTQCQAINELHVIKDLHIRTLQELGVECPEVNVLLHELSQLVTGISLIKELTARSTDYLVSFGERCSTRIFAAYLNKMGVRAVQCDAFLLNLLTTDEFTNADVSEEAYAAVAEALLADSLIEHCSSSSSSSRTVIPVVTGFLGKGIKTGAPTTLGRGGSDLTATVIGRSLGLREVQVWKDVDGVLTCDPNLFPGAVPVPHLTFEEASELAYFGAQVLHPQSMRPARESNTPVRVLNSYNPKAPGTLITAQRDLSSSLLTSIVVKGDVTMLDIGSLRMMGQVGFMAKVFSIFDSLGISVDVVATSEVSLSLTLDPARMWYRELIQQELDHMVEELEKVAVVKLLQRRSIISLIGNVSKSSVILEKVFGVFRRNGTNVQMISQGASKVNIALVVDADEAKDLVEMLHHEFFGNVDKEQLGK